MTPPARSLTFGVADLLARPGERRDESLDAVIDGLRVVGSQVPEGVPIHLDLHLQSVNAGVVVKGTTAAPWVGECRRCLRPVEAVLTAAILEIYEPEPTEGETQLLRGDHIDVEPAAREAVLLELPLAPLCRDDCAGLCPQCGTDRNEAACGCPVEEGDRRWAVLDELRFEE